MPQGVTAEPCLPRTVALYGSAVVEKLGRWFDERGRTFAWRRTSEEVAALRARGERSNDPYVVLVSEVMLQQTQTSRVAELLPRFLAAFPDVRSLASAAPSDVLRAWRGLGYNSRALRLHRAARAIVAAHGGEFPRDRDALRALDGVGAYTAAAIACFAFGDDVPVVDVNVQRVLSRLFHRCHTVDARMSERAITALDAALIPAGDAYRWHQALMDHGATICTARRPKCERCPLVGLCLSAYPSTTRFFGAAPALEPTIAGTPRRIWRGRIVDALREADERMIVGTLLDIVTGGATVSSDDRAALVSTVAMLIDDGLVAIDAAMVRESGALDETGRVRLPQ